MFWDDLDKLVDENKIVIDRKKGSLHPQYREVIYPLDYGYLENTTTVDNGGIDIFVGSAEFDSIQGIICTIDNLKKDAEIKILYKCTDKEIEAILGFINGEYMSGILIRYPKNS